MKKSSELPQAQALEFQSRLSIQLYFTLIVLAEILATIAIAGLATRLLEAELSKVLDWPPLVWMTLISACIGTVFAFFVNRIILSPIKRLNQAMKEVAKGDFSPRLVTKSRIHEVQDSYQSFNLMTRALGATETLQADFISNVSHEFKTPINAIEGYATLLQGTDNIDEVENAYIEKILFSTRRLSELVGSMLLLSKLDNQAIAAKAENFRLDEQIRQALLLLEPKWTKKNIDFDLDLQCLAYTGPESILRHVWQNLIDNAVKFSPAGGRIAIRLHPTEDSLRFEIADEGPGIAPEEQAHIFERFYQADSSHRSEGSGLGLALVRRIVELEGGRIAVDSAPGAGCRFTVDLPKP